MVTLRYATQLPRVKSHSPRHYIHEMNATESTGICGKVVDD